MGRSLSPLLRQELANLGKDADSRRSAMKTLKSYAKDLDSKAIPHFLAEVSDTNSNASVLSGECTISLYEVLARVHGRNIVPQIGNIMSTIMRTLSASGGSFAIHQACSKVVPAIARYGIDPLTSEEEKSRIICSLCKPLSDALMSLQESSAPSGAALCLKALVESTNWRFAPDEMVNEVCLKVAGALEEKITQSNAHIELVVALVKHNGLISEAYSRSFVRSGLQILAAGDTGRNSQKRLIAIQMINFLMKSVDVRSISSELFRIIDCMDKCQTDDRMPFVRSAAFEALQTAKALTGQKGSKHEGSLSPMSGFSFQSKKDRSPGENDTISNFCSAESQTVDSFIKYEGLSDSPVSVCQPLSNFGSVRRTNRRLWNDDGIRVDVSLKDGFFLKASSENAESFADELSGFVEHNEANKEHSEAFSGFIMGSNFNSVERDSTSNHQVNPTHYTTGGVKENATTTRRPMHSLQSSSNTNSGYTGAPKLNRNEQCPNSNYKNSEKKNHGKIELSEKANSGDKDGEIANDGAESVSSTGEVLDSNISSEHVSVTGNGDGEIVTGKTMLSYRRAILGFLLGLLIVVFAIIMESLRDDTEELLFEAVPT